jgi:hypothetical protein
MNNSTHKDPYGWDRNLSLVLGYHRNNEKILEPRSERRQPSQLHSSVLIGAFGVEKQCTAAGKIGKIDTEQTTRGFFMGLG